MFPPQVPGAQNALKQMPKPAREAFEAWISFFPVAPLFGVEWLFAPKTASSESGSAAEPVARSESTPAKASEPAPEPADIAKAGKELAETVAATAETATVTAAETAGVAAARVATTVAAPSVPPPAEAETTGATDAAGQAKPDNLYADPPTDPDDLKLIRGVGPALEKQLNGLGIYKFSQIAAFSDANLAWVDDNLTAFKGRCFRDDWIGQAREHQG